MATYLETNYSRDEYGENDYPQKLCDHLIQGIIRPHYNDIANKTLLDVGSGKGSYLVGFSRRGLRVFGLDKRAECIKTAEQFDIRECDVENEDFPFEKNSMDLVFSKSVLEHVFNTDNFLSETLRVLKPGGLILLMVPDWGSQHMTFFDDYTHVKAWTRKGLQNAMRIHGFKNVSCIYFRQLPLLWKYPILECISDLISVLPESFKWKDKEEKMHRKWVRFSKEKMLLATGVKPNS